jgi:hypothetical protein
MITTGDYKENGSRLIEAVKAYYADDRQPMYELMHPDVVFLTEAVRWAVSEGIASGTGTTAFSPENPCTRAQIVTFLYRHIG